MNIGALARLAGVNAETIRYYERERVLPEPLRGNAQYRVYAQADVERLLFVRR
ncbi:MAG: MerR family transcriptional regulator, partial [Gemmatimonas sp.]